MHAAERWLKREPLDVHSWTTATGRDKQLSKHAGEYLVAGQVCRRGFIGTTFIGNVPHYDIIASNGSGKHPAIQVNAIKYFY